MLLDHLFTVSHDHSLVPHEHHDHTATSFAYYNHDPGWLDQTKADIQAIFYGNWHFGSGGRHGANDGLWRPPPEPDSATAKWNESNGDIDAG